jgi:hypothetical protein
MMLDRIAADWFPWRCGFWAASVLPEPSKIFTGCASLAGVLKLIIVFHDVTDWHLNC